jgi:alkylation response protein AidB-like acyl-CoA dehydrogenase
MRLVFDEEHDQLRDSLRAFLQARSPESEVRRLMTTRDGFAAGFWSEVVKDLGLTSLIVPTEYGGTGAGQRELTVVFEEFGRALACAPLLSTVALATNALLCGDDEEAKRRHLPGILDGSTTATLAHVEPGGAWSQHAVAVTATRGGGGWLLRGEKAHVVDGASANLLLVTARTADGIGLFALSAPAAGIAIEPTELIDQTRRYAHPRFDDAPAELVGGIHPVGEHPGLTRALALAAISLAAEQLGGAERLLEMTVEYARLRTQFGRPIGSFQAIKHSCVDLLLAVEGARSAVYEATWSVDEGAPDIRLAASLAKAVASEVYYRAAQVAIQVHGGIGFTWEHPAHLYYRRAKCSELYLGDPAYHRQLIAEQLGV